MELSILRTNEKLTFQPGVSPVNELKNAADFFHNRIGLILKQKTALRRLQEQNNDSIQKLLERIGSLTVKQRRPGQSIYILLESTLANTQKVTVGYFIPSAGCHPT